MYPQLPQYEVLASEPCSVQGFKGGKAKTSKKKIQAFLVFIWKYDFNFSSYLFFIVFSLLRCWSADVVSSLINGDVVVLFIQVLNDFIGQQNFIDTEYLPMWFYDRTWTLNSHCLVKNSFLFFIAFGCIYIYIFTYLYIIIQIVFLLLSMFTSGVWISN